MVQAVESHSGVISIQREFKAVRMDEVTQRMSVDRDKTVMRD